jgi:hypothetical protein
VNLCLAPQILEIRCILMGVNIQISAECLQRGLTVYNPCHWQGFTSRISLLFIIPMLPHRRSAKATKKATPSHISPPAGGSISNRRPSDLVVHQQPFRASIAQTVEIESFVSEPSPREILPIPPPLSPPSPPDNSGPRRQQTRYDTSETLCSPSSEDRVPPQPPNAIPISTSSLPQTPEPPAPQMQTRKPAPVGGFESILEFATHIDSSSPLYETAGTSEGVHAGIWSTYNKASQEFDEKRLTKWSDDLDVLLIFVSLVVKCDR